jgi:hypothetical protein
MSLRSFLNLDFLRMAQLTGSLYTSELAKLDPLITFARASTATRFNAAGVLETVAAGQPRFDFDPVTLSPRGLLIEEARSNFVLQSANFGTTWTPNGTPGRTAGADTSCGVPLDLISDPAGNATNFYYQNVAGLTNGVVSISFFIRKGTSTQTTLQVYDATAGALRGRLFVSWVGSAPALSADNGGGNASARQINANIWRVQFTLSGVVGANTNSLYVTPCSSGTAAGNVYIGGVQAEAGGFPTSYIPTTTAAVTRAAESAKITSFAPWFNSAGGTLLFEWERVTSAPSASTVGATNPSGRYIGYQQTGSSDVKTTIGGVANQTISGGPVTGIGRLALGYSSAPSLSAVCNGGSVAALTATGLSLSGLTELWLGTNGSGGEALNGYLRRVATQPFKVSDLLLKQMTT